MGAQHRHEETGVLAFGALTRLNLELEIAAEAAEDPGQVCSDVS